jgi:hypothetical protein
MIYICPDLKKFETLSLSRRNQKFESNQGRRCPTSVIKKIPIPILKRSEKLIWSEEQKEKFI